METTNITIKRITDTEEVIWSSYLPNHLKEMADNITVYNNTMYDLIWQPETILIKNKPTWEYMVILAKMIDTMKKEKSYLAQFSTSKNNEDYNTLINFARMFLIELINNSNNLDNIRIESN